MIRCLKTDFSCDRENLEKLFACNRCSALIWNRCLEIGKEYRIKHNGEWITKTELQSQTKQTMPLHSQSIQAVVHSYCEARLAAKTAIEQGYKNKYPWRKKHAYPTLWRSPKGLELNRESGVLSLKLGLWQKKYKQEPIKVRLPKSTLERLGSSEIKEITLIWDNRLMLSICYENGIEAIKSEQGIEAAIDLGVIHSISSFCENGQAIIITGRLLRSIKRYRSKKLAEIAKKMSKCKKYSQRWKKLKIAKRGLLSKLDAQVRDITHKITRSFVDWAVKNKISKVYVGNVEGVQRKTHKKKSRSITQQLSQWNFGQQLQYLKYKLEEAGIKLIKISEAYSTQTCPICGRRHKARGRNYRCNCGYQAHRDIHGARNILSLGKFKHFEYIADINVIKYLRTA